MKYLFPVFILFMVSCQQKENTTTSSDQKQKDKNTSKQKKSDTAVYKVDNVKPPKKTEKLADGSYFEYYPNNQIHIEGQFDENDKKTGIWKSYRVDGNLWSTTEYANGIRHGESKSYHKNGQLYYEGQFVNGKRDGKWLFYDKTGKLSNEKEF